MKRFSFVAVTVAMSLASTAIAYAARDCVQAVVLMGGSMAFIAGLLSFIALAESE